MTHQSTVNIVSLYSICIDIHLSFLRILLSNRISQKRIQAKGLFLNAEVSRGHDWIWGDQDGMYDTVQCHRSTCTTTLCPIINPSA